MLRLITRSIFKFAQTKVKTDVFSQLSNKLLATPEVMKIELNRRLLKHSKMSLVSLYHKKRVRHAIKSCFSEKKSKRYKRVHKHKKWIFSQILGRNLYVRFSQKAIRCINKMESFDNYILCTKPEDLDSKMGEYYRTLMLRKINDPEYRIPYILGQGFKPRIKKYHRYLLNLEQRKLTIPKEFKKNLITFQRKFGTTVDELNEEDYKKYLDLQEIKRIAGSEMNPNHPLLMEINSKLNESISEEEENKLNEMSEKYKKKYLDVKKNKHLRKEKFDFIQKESAEQNAKIREAWIKYQSLKE